MAVILSTTVRLVQSHDFCTQCNACSILGSRALKHNYVAIFHTFMDSTKAEHKKAQNMLKLKLPLMNPFSHVTDCFVSTKFLYPCMSRIHVNKQSSAPLRWWKMVQLPITASHIIPCTANNCHYCRKFPENCTHLSLNSLTSLAHTHTPPSDESSLLLSRVWQTRA